MNCKIKEIKFPTHGDTRGKLIAIESGISIPFQFERIFYVYECAEEAVRGLHANRTSEFVMICVHGSVKVRVHDGEKQTEFLLDKSDMGLYLGAMTWKEMYDFSKDAVLLILCSAMYDPDEYIRNFNEFIKEAANNE